MLHRYGDVRFVMRMGFDDGLQLIRVAKEKVKEKQAWDMWLSVYPNMTAQTFIPFEQYYQKKPTVQKKPTRRTSKQIIEMVGNINTRFTERRGPK